MTLWTGFFVCGTLGVRASGSKSASTIADGRLIKLAGEPGSLEAHVSD